MGSQPPARRQHRLPHLLDREIPGEGGDVPAVRLLIAQGDLGLLGDAGGGLLLKLRSADNKKPPDALLHPGPHTPGQRGTEQHVLQHQRFSIFHRDAVAGEKDRDTSAVHGAALLFPDRILLAPQL